MIRGTVNLMVCCWQQLLRRFHSLVDNNADFMARFEGFGIIHIYRTAINHIAAYSFPVLTDTAVYLVAQLLFCDMC